jgi:hypothetical protein
MRICNIFLSAFILVASGCASQYKLPTDDQPFAMIKSKMTINTTNARKVIPSDGFGSSISFDISLVDNKKNYRVIAKEIPEILHLNGNQTAIETFKVHPDRPITVNVIMFVKWSTRKMERVQKTERIPKQVTRYVSEYDSYSKSYRSVSKTVTEYETKTKYVDEYVTRSASRSCAAAFTFLPEKDVIYLADYSNVLIDSGCSLSIFKQIPLKGDKFKLEPVKEFVLDEKK